MVDMKNKEELKKTFRGLFSEESKTVVPDMHRIYKEIQGNIKKPEINVKMDGSTS